MDGDDVVPSEPSLYKDGSSDDAHMSLAETFTSLCPVYMAMGMTYDEFWNCNTKVHKAYRDAWKQKKQYRNWELWMQGAYIYDALLKVAPVMRAALSKTRVDPGKYLEEPYPLTEKEANDREEAKRQARLSRLLAVLDKESEDAKQHQKEANMSDG